MEEGECEDMGSLPFPKLEEGPSTSGAGDTSPGRSSPDANCPICLGKLDNRSFTNGCFHQFCFVCLREWSNVKAECPLCKQKFKSIIHNIRDNDDYDELHLNPPAPPLSNFRMPHPWQDTFGAQPHAYRTTQVSNYLNYVTRLEEAMASYRLPSLPPSTRIIHLRRRQNGTSDFRRNIYQQGLWVQRLPDITGRVRECSPEFYRENPAMIHRLVPWLNRELNVLCSNNSQFLLSRILDLITEMPIRSPGFASYLHPYLNRHTDHFVHEFYSFATTPYDLVGFDRHANYVIQDNLAHIEAPPSSDSDSDVQVLDYANEVRANPWQERPPSPLTPRSINLASDSDDCVVVDGIVPRQQTPEVITIESDEEVVQVNIHINSETPRPGPSRRPPLKRRWLSTSDSQHVNVSININRAGPSHTRSRHSSTSSSTSLPFLMTNSSSSESDWNPGQSVSKKKKKKKKKGKKSEDKKIKKTRKSKSRKIKSPPVSSSDEEQEQPQPAAKSPPRQRHKHRHHRCASHKVPSLASCDGHREPVTLASSDEDNSVLRIDTDVCLSTDSCSTEEYKPAVTIKSETPTLPEPQESPLNLSYDPDTPDSSDSGYRGPSRSARRYSSSSSSNNKARRSKF